MKNKISRFLAVILFFFVLFSSYNVNNIIFFDENINEGIHEDNVIQIKTSLGSDTTKYYSSPNAAGFDDIYNETGIHRSARVTYDLSTFGYSLIKGVGFNYTNSSGPSNNYDLDLTIWADDIGAGTTEHALTYPLSIIGVSAPDWYNFNLGGSIYAIDNDPRVEFNSTDPSSACFRLGFGSPDNIYSEANTAGVYAGVPYEYIVDLVHENITALNRGHNESSLIQSNDLVDAYFVYLQANYEYEFNLNIISGSGSTNMRLTNFSYFTDQIITYSTGSSYNKRITATAVKTGLYILLIEGVATATYNIRFDYVDDSSIAKHYSSQEPTGYDSCTGNTLRINYTLGTGNDRIVTGVNYLYSASGSDNINIRVWGDQAINQLYTDNAVPIVTNDTWRTMYFGTSNFIIDDDPAVEFSGSAGPVSIASDNGASGHSYLNGGSVGYEYIVELLYEPIQTLNINSLTTGSMRQFDYVDAYYLQLTAGVQYGFILNRLTTGPSGNLNIKLFEFDSLTDTALFSTSGTNIHEKIGYKPSSTGTYILLVLPNIAGTDFADYSVKYVDMNAAVTPKSVSGQAGFESLTSNYMWCNGSGTTGDPYLIKGITINAKGSGNCLYISNTGTYNYTIEECTFLNSGLFGAGICINSAQEGYIYNNTLTSSDYGIKLVNGDNLDITYNKIINNRVGVYLDSSSQNNDIWLNFFIYSSLVHLHDLGTGNSLDNKTGFKVGNFWSQFDAPIKANENFTITYKGTSLLVFRTDYDYNLSAIVKDSYPIAANDSDIDNLVDILELIYWATNFTNNDTDSDGIPDGYEANNRLNPLINDANADPDNDGLTNYEEYSIGHLHKDDDITYYTDPNNRDTDNDGWLDGDEVDAGYDPTNPFSHPPTGVTPGGISFGIEYLYFLSLGIVLIIIYQRKKFRK